MTSRAAFGFACAASALVAPAGLAQEERAESTFPFEPWNAQAVAFGGAGVASPGLALLAVNPAAVARERSVLVSYRSSPAGLRDYALEAAHRFDWGTLGLAVRRRDWGELAGDLGLSGLTAGEQSVTVVYAAEPLRDRVRLGLSISRLDQDFLGNRAGGWAADLGAQVLVAGGLRLGAAALHLGEGLHGSGDTAPLPSRLRTGASWAGRIQRFHVTAASDVVMPLRSFEYVDVHAGLRLEYEVGSAALGATAGWRALGDRNGPASGTTSFSFGGGAAVGPLAVEIATSPRGAVGSDLVFTLAGQW